jgi:flagellar biosynthesis/type III secretory pathway chaperone
MRKLEELLQLLDEQIELLQQKHSLLHQMGECVRRTDATALAGLLEKGGVLGARMDVVEQRTQELREAMAEEAGVAAAKFTLGRMADVLDPPAAIALNDRRERLLLAVQKLQEESAAVSRLVRFAIEFNNELLCALVGSAKEGSTYSPQGAVEPSCEGATFRQSV